jgi:iron complex transport system substrate-binding protein
MRRILAVVALAATLTGAAACGSSGTPTPTPTTPGAVFPVTVGSVTLDHKPTKIVSLSPTGTEMLFAMDAGSQVVAVDDASNFPAAAPKTDLSGYKPNAEAIAKHQPDLVIVSFDTDKIVDQLKTLKIPTYLLKAANTMDDAYAQLVDLGALTGHPVEAEALSQQIRGELTKLAKDLPQRAKPLTYYYELDQTYYSVTSKTFIGTLFASAGLVNIADAGSPDNPYPQLSAEAIVKANPDLIFLADTKCCGQSATSVAARSGWSGLTAVTKGQVVALDDDVASRWGPRVVDLLRAITTAAAKVPTS